jgi:hypothetical protein
LELGGAMLLAELIDKNLPSLDVEINSVHLWTVSTIVLSWTSSPATRWNTMVANIVARIQETTNVQRFCHSVLYSNEKKIGHQKASDFKTVFTLHLYAAARG